MFIPELLLGVAIVRLKSEQDLIKGISKLDDMIIISTFQVKRKIKDEPELRISLDSTLSSKSK